MSVISYYFCVGDVEEASYRCIAKLGDLSTPSSFIGRLIGE
jgi:hypothetical protein